MKQFQKNLTKTVAAAGVMTALAVVLTTIHFPLVPAAPFLEYDPADIPIFLSTIIFGPWVGLGETIAASVIQGLTVSAASGVYGILMHVIATGSYVIVLGLITRKNKKKKNILLGMAAAVLTWCAVMIPANLLITPIFTGMARSVIWNDLMPFILLFNLLKSVINSVLAFLLFTLLKSTIGRFVSVYPIK